MAYDEEVAQRVRELLTSEDAVTERRMFGGVAFMVRGQMTVGINANALMARVGPENHAAALRRAHVRPMDFTGKPMRGYVYVDASGLASEAALRGWLDRCLAFVATLPPKNR
ncbi:MAG: TfoX/Sxy family protein [Gemmatimonadota bacterium]